MAEARLQRSDDGAFVARKVGLASRSCFGIGTAAGVLSVENPFKALHVYHMFVVLVALDAVEILCLTVWVHFGNQGRFNPH